VPSAIQIEEAVFFLTICCRVRGQNQLCDPRTSPSLLNSARHLHDRRDWSLRLILFMPDHAHLLASFPSDKDMSHVISEWKKYTARQYGISWQRGFFDRRLRRDESLVEKADYILNNPVRAGLVAQPRDWPYVWRPELQSGGLGQPALTGAT
jgi:putative transposase